MSLESALATFNVVLREVLQDDHYTLQSVKKFAKVFHSTSRYGLLNVPALCT